MCDQNTEHTEARLESNRDAQCVTVMPKNFGAILGLLWGYFGAMFFFGVTLGLFWGYLGLFWDSYDQDATVSSMTPNHSQ